MVKAVIFDMDGLLIDSERVTFEEMGKLAREAGCEMEKSFYVTLLGRSDANAKEHVRQKYGEKIDPAAFFDAAHERMAQRYAREGVPVKAGVRELLRQLNADGVSCAVASSSDKAWVHLLLTNAGLAEFFQAFVCGDEVTRAKPDPEIFLTACAKLGVSPPDALVLEDAETGIRAAGAAGIPVICIPDLKQPAEDLAAKTYAVLQSLTDVKTLLKDCAYDLPMGRS